MTTPTITGIKSPLGSQSRFYQPSSNANGGIIDDCERRKLEFYPAGYTHKSQINGEYRQERYKKIWELAVHNNVEKNLIPFNKKDHYIELVPDTQNTYDKNAINLILRANSRSVLAALDGTDLGFIPMKINQSIARNLSMIKRVSILKVRDQVHKKYYSVKLVIDYGDKNDFDLVTDRFQMILEE